MTLGALSLFFRREPVELRADELDLVEQEAPRALNYLLSRGLRRARERMVSVLAPFLMLAFGYWLSWTPAALLASVVMLAILTVLIDVIRYGLAKRMVHYTHAREFRALEVLQVCVALENGSSLRRARGIRPQPMVSMVVAVVCTAVLLPVACMAISALGWVDWVTVYYQPLLPLALILVAGWRLVGALYRTMVVRAATVGTHDLFLDSDDAFDVYAGVILLSWLLLLNSNGPALIALGILLARLGFRFHEWWQLRQTLPLLTRRVYRTNPNAPGGAVYESPPATDLGVAAAAARAAGKRVSDR
jgi:amino acid transporter